jgi:sulfonate transport system permease protein
LALVALWQLCAARGWLSNRVLPAPLDVATAAWTLAESGDLWTHVKVSTGRALAGLAVGGGLGLVLGLLTGSVRFFETLLDSSIQMVRNIPALALIPLVILWFGIDETAKLFLIAVAVFFPIYLNTFHGIRNVDPGLIEMGRTYGLSRWGLYTQIILPGAMSSILVGLRFSLGLMWVILIVAETISAQAGIGYMTMNAREFLQTDIVLVGILLYAALGKLADLFARGLEQYWLRWHPGYQTQR